MPKLYLQQIYLAGYTSIASTNLILDNNITLLIGPNGTGKSNLLSFFRLLNNMVHDGLQVYVGQHGYASSLLHYGPTVTEQIDAELIFRDRIDTKAHQHTYRMRLVPTAADQLIFAAEEIKSSHKNVYQTLGSGHGESHLKKTANGGPNTTPVHRVYQWLQSCRVYQFHNTTLMAKLRTQSNIYDNLDLRDDAGNLAAILYALHSNPATYPYYQRIVRYIQLVLPQFSDFDLIPSPINLDYIQLAWRDTRSPTYRFGPHQLSDGSLRFMALATLLLQPPHMLPQIILLDEPELGLHPSAITVFEAMVQIAAQHTQIILATQSPRMVDEFGSNQIVVVEQDRLEGGTDYRHLDTDT